MQEQVRDGFEFIRGAEAAPTSAGDPALHLSHVLLQVHILGVGLAVHEKLVHPEMRPLHKKLVDQFHVMRTGLHHVSFVIFRLFKTKIDFLLPSTLK